MGKTKRLVNYIFIGTYISINLLKTSDSMNKDDEFTRKKNPQKQSKEFVSNTCTD